VSFDPRARRLFLDATKNVGHRGVVWKHPESNGRETDDVQTRRSGWNATRYVQRLFRPRKFLVYER
jgi:hypothetical protein